MITAWPFGGAQQRRQKVSLLTAETMEPCPLANAVIDSVGCDCACAGRTNWANSSVSNRLCRGRIRLIPTMSSKIIPAAILATSSSQLVTFEGRLIIAISLIGFGWCRCDACVRYASVSAVAIAASICARRSSSRSSCFCRPLRSIVTFAGARAVPRMHGSESGQLALDRFGLQLFIKVLKPYAQLCLFHFEVDQLLFKV